MNKTYILITIIVLLLFAYTVYKLNTQFLIEIALSSNCNDPWAMYLNDGLRNKCVSTKQTNELKMHQQQFEKDSVEIKNNIAKIKQKISQTDEEHEALQHYIKQRNIEKWNNVKQSVQDLSGTVQLIKAKYKENTEALEKLVNDYETTAETNMNLLVQVGNNLVNKLTKNIYTPKWSKQRDNLVKAYSKIIQYIGPKSTQIAPLSSDAINGKKQ